MDGIKDTDTFDMWVDKKTKLISKVRVYDRDNKKDYIEFGQNFAGGHTLPVYTFMHVPSEHYDAKISFETDMDTSSFKGSVVFNFDENNEKWKVTVSLDATPSNSDVKINKPAGAVPLEQVLQSLGFDPTVVSDNVLTGRNDKAMDAERKVDLQALQGQLEAYYAQHGVYPSLNLLNDASWRSTNMKGLDSNALADPAGKKTALAPGATNTQYGYKADVCDVLSPDRCDTYVLTALLSDGTTYKLNSLNDASNIIVD
jgi:hypothetical protein